MEDTRQINQELKGFINIEMVNHQTLDDFCTEYIPNYNKERLAVVALRLFVAKETIMTVYALDKPRLKANDEHESLPVKKFKITDVPLAALFSFISSFNCTISTGEYDIEQMEIVNK